MKKLIEVSGLNNQPESEKQISKREYKQLPTAKELRSDQAYSFIFDRDEKPLNTVDMLKLFLPEALLSRNMSGFFTIENTLDDLRLDQVYPLAFRNFVKPRLLLEGYVFTASHPMAIKLIDNEQVKRFKAQMKSKQVITTGVLGGSVLISTKNRIHPDFRQSICIGVIDPKTNEELGVIFAPEEMLSYEFVDFKPGKRKRIIEKVGVTTAETVPVNINY